MLILPPLIDSIQCNLKLIELVTRERSRSALLSFLSRLPSTSTTYDVCKIYEYAESKNKIENKTFSPCLHSGIDAFITHRCVTSLALEMSRPETLSRLFFFSQLASDVSQLLADHQSRKLNDSVSERISLSLLSLTHSLVQSFTYAGKSGAHKKNH